MIRELVRRVEHPSAARRRRFDDLLERTLAQGPNAVVAYDLPEPKHAFLCYLCDHRGFVAHGSPHPDLVALVARHHPKRDITGFGRRTQVFASPDAIWAMWFALLDRDRTVDGTGNGCTLVDAPGGGIEKHYWFAVAAANLADRVPLTRGTVYLCRSTDFPERAHERSQEWGGTGPVVPLARLDVVPEDFPYADAVLGYDHVRLSERLAAGNDGFPWFDDEDLWVVRPAAYRVTTIP